VVLVAGLTGGIASGKSTVARFFGKLGAQVIDADELARKVVEPGTPGWHRVVETFGKEYLTPYGELDRKRLARLVFQDPQAKELLEAIIHPRIMSLRRKITREILREDPKALIIFDIPLLIEAGLHRKVDRVIVVWVPRETQIQRLIGRDKLTRQEAEERLKNQMPLDEKLPFAHYVVDNSGLLEETEKQVEKIYRELKILADAKTHPIGA
jgi:dephospho-CoA kinase